MQLAVVRERQTGENRVAVSPDSVKKLTDLGLNIIIEAGAGDKSHISDEAYKKAGAEIAPNLKSALTKADILLKVRPPMKDELKYLRKGATLIGMLDAREEKNDLDVYIKQDLQAFSLDLLPRITRAQTMDVLSSQSNLAGYRAVIEATFHYKHSFPMMMTAAGTVAPAKVLILGAGVAGLQAIATAKRLGAIVLAFDVRPSVKEQVESLGAKFVEVEGEKESESATGYAKETSKDHQKRQAQKIHDTLKSQDIVITTALIPGRPAPVLITAEMIADMKPGSVIIDMAAAAGGNVTGSKGDGKVTVGEVTIFGPTNLPSHIAGDASALYARNLVNFLQILIDKETGKINFSKDDEIIQATWATKSK